MLTIILLTCVGLSVFVFPSWALEGPLQNLAGQLNELANAVPKSSQSKPPRTINTQLKEKVIRLTENFETNAITRNFNAREALNPFNAEISDLLASIDTNTDEENKRLLQRVNELDKEFRSNSSFKNWYWDQELERIELIIKRNTTGLSDVDTKKLKKLTGLLNSPVPTIKQEYKVDCEENPSCRTQ